MFLKVIIMSTVLQMIPEEKKQTNKQQVIEVTKLRRMGSIKLDEYFKTKKNPSMKTIREHTRMKMDLFLPLLL